MLSGFSGIRLWRLRESRTLNWHGIWIVLSHVSNLDTDERLPFGPIICFTEDLVALISTRSSGNSDHSLRIYGERMTSEQVGILVKHLADLKLLDWTVGSVS